MSTKPSLARAIDARRNQVARWEDARPDSFDYQCHVDISGIGEAYIDIPFPVRFIELPLFSGGYSLADNQHWSIGSAPHGSADVLRWTFASTPSSNTRVYDGAHVVFHITGNARQKGIGHLRFSGKALIGPAGRDTLS